MSGQTPAPPFPPLKPLTPPPPLSSDAWLPCPLLVESESPCGDQEGRLAGCVEKKTVNEDNSS